MSLKTQMYSLVIKSYLIKKRSTLVDLNNTQQDKSIPLLSDFVILKDNNFHFICCFL